ncbi:DUF4270 family protein [Polaribacter cellanae]|uniref:DUF4270 family protein n=1 Tax=Polaribacter cellanae TaxID=2818493 RepID=A0A975CKX3_9FLAO|nr:DUF4270 family protein [Polaribacter cellanae]QTE21603.1 DUF4270 family protein [Polaribacter cellanae]
MVKNSIRKTTQVGVLFLLFAGIISCEKDFTDIDSGVISNTKFSTGEVALDIEISTINLNSVVADNISTTNASNIGLPILKNNTPFPVDYWLGVYNNANAKKLEAGFASQIAFPSKKLITREVVADGDTIFNLDKVVLKLPYTAVSLGANKEGIVTYRLDSILGNKDALTNVEVYRNPTQLYALNPQDPSKSNSYASNFNYNETELLTKDTNFSFKPSPTDTIFEFFRIDRSEDVNSTELVKDTLKILNSSKKAIPFLAIPLDLNKMKTTFWDKFNDTEFSSPEEFQKYFKGIILKAKGNDGVLVPFNLINNREASIDFLYSKTILKNNVVDKVLKEDYTFSLAGIKNNIYNTNNIVPVPTNSFVVQGTAGLSAEVKVLGINLQTLRTENPTHPILEYVNKDIDNNNYLDLKELASIKDISNNEFGLLVNDADLTFFVNNTLSSTPNTLPQRLYVYQNKDNGKGGVTPTHLSDSYKETNSFNGKLVNNNKIPEKYTFKITDYISNLMDGTSKDFSPLVLKVYNSTDNPLVSGSLNKNVLQYNWNPRSVVLYDENSNNKAKLKISFTRKKN